jgi:hypothetical protein
MGGPETSVERPNKEGYYKRIYSIRGDEQDYSSYMGPIYKVRAPTLHRYCTPSNTLQCPSVEYTKQQKTTSKKLAKTD